MTGELIKILGVIVIVGILAVVINQYKPEFSFVLLLSSSALILYMLIDGIKEPLISLRQMFSKSGADTAYIAIVLKSVAVAYLSSFVADILRENGMISLASKAELAGKCAILVLSFPLITAVLEIALGFVNL